MNRSQLLKISLRQTGHRQPVTGNQPVTSNFKLSTSHG
jgi:hypothetical protein